MLYIICKDSRCQLGFCFTAISLQLEFPVLYEEVSISILVDAIKSINGWALPDLGAHVLIVCYLHTTRVLYSSFEIRNDITRYPKRNGFIGSDS